ncbi:MAG: PAS domain S-box protein [Spirochaetes bacterium]|nr:MAG: PAS domain S-box protein [Spirochaetota bacterium]
MSTKKDHIPGDKRGETHDYKGLFRATPLPVFILGRDYRIRETNTRFDRQFAGPRQGDRFCYEIFHDKPLSGPCPQCPATTAFLTGKDTSAVCPVEKDGGTTYYRKDVVPVKDAGGAITTVMIAVQDITDSVERQMLQESHSRDLENTIHIQIDERRAKERMLSVLVNTIYEIKGVHHLDESMDRIISGFSDLGAQFIVVVMSDERAMKCVKAHPAPMLSEFESILGAGILGRQVSPKRHPRNPFVHAVRTGKPMPYRGERGIRVFLQECFAGLDELVVERIASRVRDTSIVVFPLKTNSTSLGAIGLSIAVDTLERNYEYLNFLANTAAIEFNRQISSMKLQASEEKYRNLVERSRDMIILCDRAGIINYSNRIFYKSTGISTLQKKGLSVYSLFTPEGGLQLKFAVDAALSSSSGVDPIELPMSTVGKGDIWTEIMINSLEKEHEGFQIVARDISRRKSLERLVGNLSAFQEKILQNDFIGIITTDLAGTITSWNKGARFILGYASHEVLQKNVSDLIIGGDPESPRRMSAGGSCPTHQVSSAVRFQRRDGRPVNVLYVESAMRDETGTPLAIIAFFFDNTEKIELVEKGKELTSRLHQAQLITILSLAKLTEYRDIETGMHLERIMRYTEILAREMANNDDYRDYITEEYIRDLVNSCPLHDIGKVGIPDSILHKPGKLTREEFEVIKRHSTIGGDTIAEAEKRVEGRSYLNLGKEIAYYHHERWDGSGYPMGLAGTQIPLSARIVAVADVYDALISKRPYKDPYPHHRAIEIITGSAGSHFDESVVRCFMDREKDFQGMGERYLQ